MYSQQQIDQLAQSVERETLILIAASSPAVTRKKYISRLWVRPPRRNQFPGTMGCWRLFLHLSILPLDLEGGQQHCPSCGNEASSF